MFSVVSKLKNLKPQLRKLNRLNRNVFDKVKILKAELEKIQTEMEADPSNEVL